MARLFCHAIIFGFALTFALHDHLCIMPPVFALAAPDPRGLTGADWIFREPQ